MSLTHEDVTRILAILDEAHCEEVDIEVADFKLHLRKHGHSLDRREESAVQSEVGVQSRGEPDRKTATSTPASQAPNREDIPEGVVAVTAPMLGTFYRASSPGEKPFVEKGATVAPDDTVCLVEVMKLFNSVKAGVAGTVEKILAENGALVQYGQPLILIRKENS